MGRLVRLAGVMTLTWASLLLLLVAFERLIAPMPTLPDHLGGPLATGVLKPLLALALASLWLYAWRSLIKLYRRRALRRWTR